MARARSKNSSDASEEYPLELMRLPPGRHGLPPEFVARNQRERLIAAAAEAVAEHGYAGTTVAHITRLAAVSRRTFYEHFSDKKECFRAHSAKRANVPPGRQRLSSELILQHKRTRIILAFAEETAEKGYEDTALTDIIRRARVARNTFYKALSSTEECLPAALELAGEEAQRRVIDAAAGVESWPARVNAGLDAFLRYVAAEPALAYTCIVEAFSVSAGIERYERLSQTFASFFRTGREASPEGNHLPPPLEEMVVGGIARILHQLLVMHRVDEIEGIRPALVEFSLTPYVGTQVAKRTAAEAPAAVTEPGILSRLSRRSR
ncbi:MAG: TetR/AcrR family transcriptional regulator [Solirubrobacterales bacterium]